MNPGLSMGEILLILFVALLVFGGKLPETARRVGTALSEFKRGMREELRKVEDGERPDGNVPDWRREKKPPPPEPPVDPPPVDPTRRDP